MGEVEAKERKAIVQMCKLDQVGYRSQLLLIGKYCHPRCIRFCKGWNKMQICLGVVLGTLYVEALIGDSR